MDQELPMCSVELYFSIGTLFLSYLACSVCKVNVFINVSTLQFLAHYVHEYTHVHINVDKHK